MRHVSLESLIQSKFNEDNRSLASGDNNSIATVESVKNNTARQSIDIADPYCSEALGLGLNTHSFKSDSTVQASSAFNHEDLYDKLICFYEEDGRINNSREDKSIGATNKPSSNFQKLSLLGGAPSKKNVSNRFSSPRVQDKKEPTNQGKKRKIHKM